MPPGTVPPPNVSQPLTEGLPLAHYAGWSPIPGYPSVPAPYLDRSETQGLGGTQLDGQAKCVVRAQQPIVPVPIYQEIRRKQKIIEVPQTVITDKVVPKLYHQEVFCEVPRLAIELREKKVPLDRTEFREVVTEVPVPVQYNYKIIPTWEIREVPKLVPKFVGKQEIIRIEVPQIQVVERLVVKESPVYVGEKYVTKEVYEDDPIDEVEYKYMERVQEVPIIKYRPVLDVEVDIPPPLIVPVPVKPVSGQIKHQSDNLRHRLRQHFLRRE
eukprot:GHVN01000151.1.p1 GENE.GHVN01000151.1~~GHVN01000151.1.p1  ORF type:complete len:309 (-),score=36.96 GHVN01000151.1:99-908(-)